VTNEILGKSKRKVEIDSKPEQIVKILRELKEGKTLKINESR